MTNEIIIHEDALVYVRLSIVAKAYSRIWRNSDKTIDISENDWMFINIILEFKIKANKGYRLKVENKTVVNKKFDLLHLKDKLE